jgi:hypothetical protein
MRHIRNLDAALAFGPNTLPASTGRYGPQKNQTVGFLLGCHYADTSRTSDTRRLESNNRGALALDDFNELIDELRKTNTWHDSS